MQNHNVRVGNLTYDVKAVNHPETVNQKEVAGSITYSTTEIRVRTDGFSEQKQEETWWHEVVHAIVTGYGIELGEQEEEIIQRFAVGLHALMMDNGPLPGQKGLVRCQET